MTAAYDALQHEICVGLGWCGCVKHGKPLHVDLIIPSYGPVHADQFAEWVILADNVNPNDEKAGDWKQHIRAVFVKHMGAEIVEASQLRWTCSDEAS